eukprot:1160751-Pelagomonas_calceolata.AAC.3
MESVEVVASVGGGVWPSAVSWRQPGGKLTPLEAPCHSHEALRKLTSTSKGSYSCIRQEIGEEMNIIQTFHKRTFTFWSSCSGSS